jgi:hypothetical protein
LKKVYFHTHLTQDEMHARAEMDGNHLLERIFDFDQGIKLSYSSVLAIILSHEGQKEEA